MKNVFKWSCFFIGSLLLMLLLLEYRSEAVRVQCVRQIMKLCQSFPFPIIAAGDFNSTPIGFPGAQQTPSRLNAMSILFQEGGFTSAVQHSPDAQDFTFPSEKPGVIIDWVLGKGDIAIIESKVIPSALSDHLMVTAIVRMKEIRK